MSEASDSAVSVPTVVPSVRERRARPEDDRAGWEWCVERVVRMLVCLSGRAKRLRRRGLHWYDEAAVLKVQRGSFSRYLRALMHLRCTPRVRAVHSERTLWSGACCYRW